jgi:SAM-dependent methyltransferase
MLGTGNSAKAYCLDWIERYVNAQDREVNILDLGCGTAAGFISLLKQYPQVRYVGIEPLRQSYLQAQQNLKGCNAVVLNALGYDVDRQVSERFDIVVSFSALEHVFKREKYLQSARDCMKPEGHILINYDAGHFVVGGTKDRVKNLVGPVLARLGVERYYQSFVKERDFLCLVEKLGLRVIDAKYFNTGLKGVYKVIPEPDRPEYMQRWLDFELWLNELPIEYRDSRAATFYTRNFILSRQ